MELAAGFDFAAVRRRAFRAGLVFAAAFGRRGFRGFLTPMMPS
ncbi:MAG TPA: hypothetical protein VGS57_15055 [Thermoanaerobaculia bacterium]|nr:hypothetical protein [Thermoanaerobaculia bacterium]